MTRMIIAAALAALAAPLAAQEPVNLRPDQPAATVPTPQGPAEIGRIQDNANRLEGDWARTSRPCPPFCIQPMRPAEGVTPIGQLELIEMLELAS